FRKQLEGNTVNPMDLKKRLARELVTQLYDAKAATKAEENFARVVQKKEVPDDIPEIRISFKSNQLPTNSSLIFQVGFASSSSEAFRLVMQGGVTIDGKKITDNSPAYTDGSIIKVGKRRYFKVVDADKTT
ncbi:MAG: tyrosine--tRNA ligase, partial [Dehalococcoidales bacterium]